jgi:PKD repeat protein
LTAFRFDASASRDPNNDFLSYSWDFGDGRTGRGVRTLHVYATPGTYTVRLTVSDGELSAELGVGTVTVGEVTASVDPSKGGVAGMTAYHFEAGPGSDPDGDTLTFTWRFGDQATATGARATHTYDRKGRFTPMLTVADSSSNTIEIELSEVTVNSMDGTWEGYIAGYGAHVELCMELTQVGTAITGRYTDDYGDGTLTGSITTDLALSLAVIQPPFEPFRMEGWVDQQLEHGGGTVFNYFVGGPASYGMQRSEMSGCAFSSGVAPPAVRLRRP